MRTGVYGNHPQQQRGSGLEGIAHDRKWTKKIRTCQVHVCVPVHMHMPSSNRRATRSRSGWAHAPCRRPNRTTSRTSSDKGQWPAVDKRHNRRRRPRSTSAPNCRAKRRNSRCNLPSTPGNRCRSRTCVKNKRGHTACDPRCAARARMCRRCATLAGKRNQKVGYSRSPTELHTGSTQRATGER